MKAKCLMLLLIFKLDLHPVSFAQEFSQRSNWGFGLGVKANQLNEGNEKYSPSYDLSMTVLTYEYSVFPRLRIGSEFRFYFGQYAEIATPSKNRTFSVPIKLHFNPSRLKNFGLLSSMGISILSKNAMLSNQNPPVLLKKTYWFYEIGFCADLKIKNLVIRPLFLYEKSINPLVINQTQSSSNVNYNAFSIGMLLF